MSSSVHLGVGSRELDNIVHASAWWAIGPVGQVAIVPQTHLMSSRGTRCCVFRVSRNLVLEPGKIITQGGN